MSVLERKAELNIQDLGEHNDLEVLGILHLIFFQSMLKQESALYQ